MLRLKLLLDLRLFRGQPTSTPPAWSASIPLAISSSLRAAASGSVNLLGVTNFMGSAYHGQPDIIRPSVAADRDRVAAPMIGAIDQETANATGSHFSEGDLLGTGEGGHALFKPDRSGETIANGGMTSTRAYTRTSSEQGRVNGVSIFPPVPTTFRSFWHRPAWHPSISALIY
jgi:hypothetical protein